MQHLNDRDLPKTEDRVAAPVGRHDSTPFRIGLDPLEQGPACGLNDVTVDLMGDAGGVD